MVDLRVLKKRGIDNASLKSLFTAKSLKPGIEEWRKRAWYRAQNGIESNCLDFVHWLAVDRAWEVPLNTVGASLLQSFAGSDPAQEGVRKVLKEFDITKYIREVPDKKTGKPKLIFDAPAFYEVIVPLMRAGVIARWARITNERDTNPFLKYDPILNDPVNRARCGILNKRLGEIMSAQMDYPSVEKQSILKMLLYAVGFMFINEEWHDETQTLFDEQGNEKETVVKEGVRYHVPHPSRIFYDKAWPAVSFNTDTGCNWAGYWRIKRYGELKDNKLLWNADKISIGTDWIGSYPSYFHLVYPCVMQFPNRNNRGMIHADEEMSNQYYASDQRDMGVMVTEYFEKLVPKDVGLGDYKHPVWFRVVFAGDGTVLYMAPLPDTPVIVYSDVVDDSRSKNVSWANELIPFQDVITNQLSQAILSAKQNLASMVFMDEDTVDASCISAIENSGEAFYRSRKIVKFSGRKLIKGQNDIGRAVLPVSFPQLDVNSTLATINVVLNIMERVLQISSQEMGAAASHEQSAKEIEHIGNNINSRLRFTSAPVDRAKYAWKRQLYSYLMAYGEEDIYVQIPADESITRELLEGMGFTVEEHATEGQPRFNVRGKKTALIMDFFSSVSEGSDGNANVSMANAMAQILASVLNNAAILPSIGPDQAIKLLNQILAAMGLPKDFKLRNINPGPQPGSQEFQQQLMQQLVPMIQQAQQATIAEITKGIGPLVQKVNTLTAATQGNAQAIEKITQVLSDAQTPTNPMARGPLPEGPGMAGNAPVQGLSGVPEPSIEPAATPAYGGPVGEYPAQ